MRNKKLISRILVMLLSILMMLTSIPFNLIAFADDGGGAGGGFGGGGGSQSVTDNPINDEDIGLRFSLVTKDSSGETTVVPNIYGKYYLDVWDSTYFKESWYGAVNSYSRYSPKPEDGNIKRWSDATFDKTIQALIKKSGKGSVNMDISSHLQPGEASSTTFFTEGEGGLKINGNLFYSWFMEKAGTWNGEKQSRYALFLNALYHNKLNGINMDNTFLVVEPVLHLANPTTDGNFLLTGTEYIASWYGYVEGNLDNKSSEGRDLEPGSAFTLRDRFSNIANNFRVTKTDYLTTEMSNKMQEVLGVKVPKTLYAITGEKENGASIAYGDGRAYYHRNSYAHIYNFHYRYNGFAMQIFWLKGVIDNGLPIDTFDIINKTPNTPENAETPSSDNQTDGEKTIIKLYCDLYKDPNTQYYTQIVDKAQFVQQKTSDKVTITNEEPINGYKVSAWYTSKDGYKSTPLGSSMFATANEDTKDTADGAVSLSDLGGKQLRINNYKTATDYAASGGKSYFAEIRYPHGPNGNGYINNTGLSQYTGYKRLAVKGKSNYGTYDYKVKNGDKDTYVELGDANTIVILYTREMSYISTTDTSVTSSTDERKSNSGNFNIVKVYGTINPSTYEITDISRTVLSNTTRNVNIKNESGYDLAEWIYLTGGAGTSITAEQMGKPNLSQYLTDGSADQAYRLDGFVDGFKNNSSYSKAFTFKSGDSLKMPSIYTITGSNGLTSSVTPGRYSFGSRSGIGTKSYNSTIYFGGDKELADNVSDSADTNDVLKPIGLYFFAFFQKNN